MKKYFIGLLLFISMTAVSQQPQDASTLHETAKGFLKQGDYENAILVLNRALQLDPGNMEVSKDLLFTYYLKRDFARAMEIGKPLVERADADVQAFQIMGLVYRSIAENKEAEKLYKNALKKFPNAGIIYSEYGDLIAEKEIDNAVKTWEKGIESEPNHSSNYYYLAKQYGLKGNSLWSILYGEIFLNMESFTPRSTEIKNLLLQQYKKFYVSGYVPPPTPPTKGRKQKVEITFTGAVAEVLQKQQPQTAYGITPETLTAIRTRFILDWYEKYGQRFPFRLFEHQRQLLQEGMFEAYNFWLFGPAANLKTYQTWEQYHKDELNTFLGFVRSKVFKIPSGQQYRTM